jgi:hypothetical protein
MMSLINKRSGLTSSALVDGGSAMISLTTGDPD